MSHHIDNLGPAFDLTRRLFSIKNKTLCKQASGKTRKIYSRQSSQHKTRKWKIIQNKI